MPAKFKGAKAVGRQPRLACPARPETRRILEALGKERVTIWRAVDVSIQLLAMDIAEGLPFPRELFRHTNSRATRVANEAELNKMAIGWTKLRAKLQKMADEGVFGEKGELK